jgi:hypothetical protein
MRWGGAVHDIETGTEGDMERGGGTKIDIVQTVVNNTPDLAYFFSDFS